MITEQLFLIQILVTATSTEFSNYGIKIFKNNFINSFQGKGPKSKNQKVINTLTNTNIHMHAYITVFGNVVYYGCRMAIQNTD